MNERGGLATGFLLLAVFMAACTMSGEGDLPSQGASECVVLLHGLGRTARSMEDLEQALRRAGYATANIDYPSRSESIATLSERVVPEGINRCREEGARRIHFVTHSMGGIIVRHYLGEQRPVELGRVVMLSPPNRGSEVADELGGNRLYQWFNGPAGQELGTRGLPARLGPVDYPVGIITGNRAALWDRWFSTVLPGEDDGKVSVASARLEGMRDFLVVPYSHTFIMKREEVIKQVIHFLRNGRFRHPADRQRPGQAPAGAALSKRANVSTTPFG